MSKFLLLFSKEVWLYGKAHTVLIHLHTREAGESMNAIKLQQGFHITAVEIPCLFIDNYIADCPPVYPLIYIFSLRHLLDGGEVSVQEIASYFRLTESDVLNAWKHWENVGLVKIDNKKEMQITFLPIQPAKKVDNPTLQLVDATAEVVRPVARPQYSVQELSLYRDQSRDIEKLFACAEDALGKLLSYNDMDLVFGFHDWLRLPLDVIAFLLNYCKENDHRSLRYIEKCAIDWADQGIDNVEKAADYVQAFDKDYRAILSYMGQPGYPSQSHKKYMDRWLNHWAMPMEIIFAACDRSVAQIDKAKFNYIDKILQEWHKSGINTLEAIQAADDAFSKTKEVKKTAKAPKTNRFINFTQRDTDYSKYEKLEKAYLAQKLKN